MDLSPGEFEALYLSGYISSQDLNLERVDYEIAFYNAESLDWRKKKMVTPVKN